MHSNKNLSIVKLLLVHIGSLESVDLSSCESTVHELFAVVEDDAVSMMVSKACDEAIVGNTLEESSVVGEECHFGCFSPRVGSCMSQQPHVSVGSGCEDNDRIMTPVMQIIPELQELCSQTSPLSMVHL
jgi:hypothetical protein